MTQTLNAGIVKLSIVYLKIVATTVDQLLRPEREDWHSQTFERSGIIPHEGDDLLQVIVLELIYQTIHFSVRMFMKNIDQPMNAINNPQNAKNMDVTTEKMRTTTIRKRGIS